MANPTALKPDFQAVIETAADGARLRAGGAWTLAHAEALDRALAGLRAPGARRLVIDLGGVSRLDTAGAWLAERAAARWRADGLSVEIVAGRPENEILIEHVAAALHPTVREAARPGLVVGLLARVGAAVASAGREFTGLLGFLGLFMATLGRTLVQPWRLRRTALVAHMESAGLDALPISCLISFLIGIVLAYQGAEQLARFGAQVFIVNLIGISILREIGILLTAIIVAGRSGSAFTASIGSMKLGQELDAMRTLGLDPMELLVLPRVLALVIMLPCLAFVANLSGLLGGGLMSWAVLDVNPIVYLTRLRAAVDTTMLAVGLVKAPFFALVIGLIGCRRGLTVAASAESLGAETTRSVVESIFVVIVLNALFSVFFAAVGI